MSQNKNKFNAFYYFMLDWKTQEENKGRILSNMKAVQNDPKLSEAWRNLNSSEKLIYKEKEKNGKLKQNLDKKTSLGESVDELLQIQIREKNLHDRMIEHISCMVKGAQTNNSVHKLKFYVIHVNYYCVYDCENPYKYSPSEVALVEFSLEKGVQRSYHKIINSEIRKGYAHEVNIHSNSTHQIPKEPDFGEKDYGKIFQEICEFVKPDNSKEKQLPLFTLFGEEITKKSVVSVLDFLASFNKECSNNFSVYSFEELFVSLYNNLKDESCDPLDEVIVSLQIKKDPFDYKSSLCCDFHKIGSGGNFCSKSLVQRWIFILFSNVCSLVNINLIPGHHVPIENLDLNEEKVLNKSFAELNVLEDTCASEASFDWDHKNTIKSRSERTYRDEEIRKAQSKPPLVTYHGSFENNSVHRSVPSQEESVSTPREYFNGPAGIHMAENNFPAIGRGAAIRKYMKKISLRKLDMHLVSNERSRIFNIPMKNEE